MPALGHSNASESNNNGFFDIKNAVVQDITSHVIEINNRIAQGQNEPPDAGESYKSFVSCITRYKDRGFKEEQEVRIVALPKIMSGIISNADCDNQKPEKERKFRDKNGSRVPYIELFRSLNKPLPIEKIIVGPHRDKEARAAALRVMLRNTDIDVTFSEIPFIGQ